MTLKTFALCLLPFAILGGGCKSPFDRTKDASNAGATGTFSGKSTFVIFSSELVSGGGAFEYPGSDGQSLSFNDTSNPISQRSIRYAWTGGAVSNPGGSPNPESTFAGFDLMHTATLGDYASTPGRNLTKAGYTKVTFYARGSLSTNTDIKIEVADDGNVNTPDPCITLSANGIDDHCNDIVSDPLEMAPKTLTSSWQQYTITVPNSALANIKDFFKATFVFTPSFGAPSGQGGTVCFDVIQYQP